MKQIVLLEGQKHIGYVENVNYIRKQANGSYCLCNESIAEGVAYNGNTYKLHDRGDNVEGKVVIVVDIDAGIILKNINLANSITFVTLAEENKIDEVTADEHKSLFNDFEPGVNYEVGQIRKYENKLYKCVSAHTSQSDWTPDVAVSLWKQISNPNEEYPTWSQPVGSFDCYMKGDRVTHNEKKYVSLIDNNVWEPGTYGWGLIEGEVTENG